MLKDLSSKANRFEDWYSEKERMGKIHSQNFQKLQIDQF